MDNTQYCKCGVVVYSYADNHCSNCGAFINEDGTTGKPYAELEAENKELFYRAAVSFDLEKGNTVLCNFCVYEHYEGDPPCDECKQGKSFEQRIGTLGFNDTPCYTCYQGDKFKQRLVNFEEKIKELEAENTELKRRAAWYLKLISEKEILQCEACKDSFSSSASEPCKSCKYSYDHNSKDNFTPAPVPDDFEVKNG